MRKNKIFEGSETVDETLKNPAGEEQETNLEESVPEDKVEKVVPLEDMTKEELIDGIGATQELADKNYDLYVRSQAEIENVRKRFQKDKQDLAKFANEMIIKQLLPVADNLEKAITHTTDENALDALREGIDLTLKSFLDTLEKNGVERVEALNQPFDPNFHEAVSQAEDNAVEPGTVVNELQKGYTLNKRLIRPAMVVVSRKSS
ncbi:MAG TPA: nucleotide exchange factor GrpE [Deltaproteobacteria bacterium]|nr:nucleotide exchange factor GrpE [Deltaproteobacteria bacterium]HIJ36295.1 nucleotide exchange factor GrpE [Deltaproteobacteria bacterium]HIJ40151.1 nucleotide exchange factor GrpE [Deltaproteobacteria bacterium]